MKKKRGRGDKKTQIELLERRKKVRKLILKGYPLPMIADEMKIPVRTIRRDSVEIAKEFAKEFDKMESRAEVIKIINQFDEVYLGLKRILVDTLLDEKVRIKAYDSIMTLIDKRAKTMSRFGVVPTGEMKLKIEGDDPLGLGRMLEIIREKEKREGENK